MELLLYLALVPALGVTAQWLAWRTRLPGILLLLIFGILLGQFVQVDVFFAELTGGDEGAGPNLLFPIVSLSVAVIMFEGGLSLRLRELRESGSASLRLVTLGALFTFVGNAAAAIWILGFPWRISLLLGAILVVTGPTVIGPLLRQVRPSKRVAATLKWEGIVIDPVGAVLAVLVYEELVHSNAPTMASLTGALVWTAAVGLTLGAIGGAMLTLALRRFWVPDHLQGTAALATALLLFALSDTLAHESGLITVTVMGIWLANQKNFSIEHIIELKENLRTLLIGCLFVVLGSRVNLADVAAIGLPGIGFVLALILIVRPASVFLSLLGSPLGFREQAFVAGLAPRGIVAAAVSSVFALDLESRTAGAIEGADQLATATFLVIIATVAVYGIAAEPLARLLRLADESDNGLLIAGASPWVRAFACEVHQAGIPVVLVDSNFNKISKARVDGLNAVCANILNEHVREDLDLVGIGRFLAMTPNDEVNSLAQRECRSLFGSSAVFQLTFNSKNSGGERGLTQDIMGRELFSDNCTFSSMEHAFEAGAKFKTTNLTATYTYEDFRDRNGPGTVVLCTIKEDGSLRLNSVDDPIAPAPGHTVIAMVTSEGSR